MYLYTLILMFFSNIHIYFQEQKINNLNQQSIFDIDNKYNLTSHQVKIHKEISMNLHKYNFLKILENNDISSISKLEHINNYQDEFISINITKRDLYNDFNFQI